MESGKTVFNEGDFGDLMYIILRGSVNVLKRKKTFYGEFINQTIAVLYDGSHFGELAMLGTAAKNPRKNEKKEEEKKDVKKEPESMKYVSKTGIEEKIEAANQSQKEVMGLVEPPKPKIEEIEGRSKRAATIVVSESTDFLALPRDKFKSVFLDLVQKELDTKLNILMSMHFFDKIDPISLISLANNINVKKYKMGEVILPQGEELDRLRIISGGKCRIVMAIVKSSDLDSAVGRSSLIKPLKGFNFSKTDYSCASTTRVKEEAVIKMPKVKSNIRSFDFEPLTEINEGEEVKEIKYVQHITFGVLGKSDFFGARGVFTKEEWMSVEEEGADAQEYYGPARLNVVADSYEVEIYEIERDRLPFVHEYVRRMLKKGLKDCKDYDDLKVPDELKKIENWEAMKQWTMHHNLKPRDLHTDNYKRY